jgi:hypothetical protein
MGERKLSIDKILWAVRGIRPTILTIDMIIEKTNEPDMSFFMSLR